MNLFTTVAHLDRPAFKRLRRNYQARIRTFPKTLELIPTSETADHSHLCNPPFAAWRSRDFLVQGYHDEGHVRLSVNRTGIDNNGMWIGGITWDDLMTCKAQVGFGDRWAVEVFPPVDQVVNVANIRHLWIVDRPPFAWTRDAQSSQSHD